jgi:hypothetical protein
MEVSIQLYASAALPPVPIQDNWTGCKGGVYIVAKRNIFVHAGNWTHSQCTDCRAFHIRLHAVPGPRDITQHSHAPPVAYVGLTISNQHKGTWCPKWLRGNALKLYSVQWAGQIQINPVTEHKMGLLYIQLCNASYRTGDEICI